MPMREDCKHFQSRTYASGEVARFCVLDLAPEAPWRCPDDCKAYERRLADAGWEHGSLVEPPIEDEPAISSVSTEEMVAILDDAESIVSAIAPEALKEARAEDARRERRAAHRWWRRKR
jgi:hypothetical protein